MPLDRSRRIQNANLARAKSRAAASIVNRMLLAHEYRLHTSTLVHLPAIPERSDFDGRHGKNCIPFIWAYLFA